MGDKEGAQVRVMWVIPAPLLREQAWMEFLSPSSSKRQVQMGLSHDLILIIPPIAW